MPRIERSFHVTIISQAAIGDLDDKQHLIGTRRRSPVKVVSRFQDGEIRLWLAQVVEVNGILHRDDPEVVDEAHQHVIECIHSTGMVATDGRHGDELSFDEFNAVVLGQNAVAPTSPIYMVVYSATVIGRRVTCLLDCVSGGDLVVLRDAIVQSHRLRRGIQ